MRQTSTWLPETQYKWLRRTAFDRMVSQSQIIRELIAAAMAAKGNTEMVAAVPVSATTEEARMEVRNEAVPGTAGSTGIHD